MEEKPCAVRRGAPPLPDHYRIFGISVDRSHHAIRVFSSRKRPPHGPQKVHTISENAVSAALREYSGEFEKAHAVHIDFARLIEDSCLDNESATYLYMIAQEGLRNAVIHGSDICVALCCDDHTMRLRVNR